MHCYVSHSGSEIGWKIVLSVSSHPFRRVANLALTPLLLRSAPLPGSNTRCPRQQTIINSKYFFIACILAARDKDLQAVKTVSVSYRPLSRIPSDSLSLSLLVDSRPGKVSVSHSGTRGGGRNEGVRRPQGRINYLLYDPPLHAALHTPPVHLSEVLN